MAVSLPHRLTVALATGAAASALAAAPALATEPGTPPPSNQLPSGVSPVVIPPVPQPASPAKRAVRRAKLVPRRVRSGRRSQLRISLNTPTRLKVVMRGANGKRIRAYNVAASGLSVTLKLPKSAHGHALLPGRYQIKIVAIDGAGQRSAPIVKTLVVRRGHR